MVHNGIEYGDMQLIAETYDIMKRVLGMTPDEMSQVFGSWNEGKLSSFLIEITAKVLGTKDSITGEPLVEKLLEYDAVLIAGQAKSHCVAWTIDDLLTGIAARDRALAEKVYMLEDCSSPVVVPGVVDYTDEAEAAFDRFAEAGMHVVRSTEPLSSWLEAKPAVTL
jgi:hypothetical protein